MIIKKLRKLFLKNILNCIKIPHLQFSLFLRINILGEVRTPGYYYVTDIENMTGILALAGGVTGSAATGDIYIIRGNEEILVRCV